MPHRRSHATCDRLLATYLQPIMDYRTGATRNTPREKPASHQPPRNMQEATHITHSVRTKTTAAAQPDGGRRKRRARSAAMAATCNMSHAMRNLQCATCSVHFAMCGMPCPTCNVHSETSSKQAMGNMQRAACNMRCDACIVKCATPPPQHATRIRKRETCIAKIATCVHASYKMQRLARNMQRAARNETAGDGAGAVSRALLPGAVEVARRRARQQRQHLLHTTEGVARAEDLSRHERSRRRCGVA
jgi:hypothetical protein